MLVLVSKICYVFNFDRYFLSFKLNLLFKRGDLYSLICFSDTTTINESVGSKIWSLVIICIASFLQSML